MPLKKFIKDLFVVETEEMDDVEVSPRVEQSKDNEKVKTVNFTESVKDRKPKEQENVREKKNQSRPQRKSHRGDEVDMSKINTKVCLFEPYVFGETQDIADQLKSNQTALVNLSRLDSVSKKRIIDFLSGTVYALEGDIQKVGGDIFLCTPNSVGVEGAISEEIDSETM